MSSPITTTELYVLPENYHSLKYNTLFIHLRYRITNY